MAGMLSASTVRGKIELALRDKGFKFQYGHYYLGNWRFQFRPASVALTKRVGEGASKQWTKKGWWYYGKVNVEEFCKLADKVVSVTQEAQAKARAERPATNGAGVEVKENDQKDGVEVKFAEKPEQSVIDNMKAHGFRWSKFQKLWYARRSPETLEFAYGLAGKTAEIPQGPDMNTVLEGEETGNQGPDPEDTTDYADCSHDVTALTGEPVYAQPQEAASDDPSQFKFGGAVNNPEYAAGQV